MIHQLPAIWQLITWAMIQILMIVFTRFASLHHGPAINAFRKYIPVGQITEYENPFHKWALGMAILADAFLCIILLLLTNIYLPFIMGLILILGWYGVFFDRWVNEQVPGRSKYHVSEHSTIDSWFIKKYGARAGEQKQYFGMALIIILNTIGIFLILL